MANHKPSIVGQVFGRLTVLRKIGEFHSCLCSCGVKKSVRTDHLKTGHTTSCGCARREYLESVTKPKTPKTPRPSIDEKFPHWKMLRSRWYSMVSRCTRPEDSNWSGYGARGIGVCDRWLTFENFYADMSPGFRPVLTLERKDNSAGYSPDNCRWATPLAQARNRRNNVMVILDDGSHVPVSIVAKKLHWPYNKVYGLCYRVKAARGDVSWVPTLTEMMALYVFPDDPLPPVDTPTKPS